MASANDLRKDLIVSRYEDLLWVDDVKGLQCGRCERVLINHYISNCGHKFCLNCQKILGDGSRRWRCPLPDCKKTIEDIHLQDFFFEEKVFELRAHCPNHKYGCPLVAQLKDIGGHLRTCKDTQERALPVLLDENDKINDVIRAVHEMSHQLNKVNERIEAMSEVQREIREMRDKEREQDRKWEEMDRKWEEMDRKWEEEKRRLRIELRDEIAIIKQDKKSTESENEKQKSHTTAQEVSHRIIKPELELFRLVDEYHKEKPAFTWVLNEDDVIKLNNGSKGEFVSEVFPLKGHPFSAQAQIKYAGYATVLFHLRYVDRAKSDKDPLPTPVPHFCLTLKNQLENKEHKDAIRKKNFIFKERVKYNTFEYYNINFPLNTKDDQLVIDVHVEAPEVARSVYSNDGTLTWAIDGYRKRKQAEVDGCMKCHYSPYFYTSINGYRVQVKAYLNGYSGYKNKGLCMYIEFLAGVNDEALSWSFPHTITLTFFHPKQPNRKISKCVKRDHIGYVIQVGTDQEVEQLLYNDTLHYTVSIKEESDSA